MGRAEKEKSMPFLVQLSSLWFRTTTSHCRACKRSVLQSLPFNSLLSPSGLHKSLTGRASHSWEKEKKGERKKLSLQTPLKYIVVNHGSSGGHFTDGRQGSFLNDSFYLDVRTAVVFLPFRKKFALLAAWMRNICNTYHAAWSHSG